MYLHKTKESKKINKNMEESKKEKKRKETIFHLENSRIMRESIERSSSSSVLTCFL